MRVNSAFTGFFTNRLVVGAGIATVMLAVFLITSSFTEHSGRDFRAKQVNLIIRQIGHRLLLQAGDSTSRILPVTENKEGTFLLRFESEFVFNHDSLMVLSQGLLPKTQFPSGYTVTVHDCAKSGIVYGFQVNNTSPDILACSGRSQPSGCYTIEFAFPDFYENVKQQNAVTDRRAASVKADTQVVNAKPDEFKAATFGYGSGQQTEKRKSAKTDAREVDSKLEEIATTTFDYPLVNMVYGGIFVLLSVTLLVGHFGGKSKAMSGQNPNYAVIKEPVPELASLGSFLFNVKGQRLLLGSEVISLTDKECKVLELLHKHFGELIPRETLMQEVWINEGVFTGRSLDMFVSKLRKKLSHDPELRITNVHGKGYKLEMPERPVKAV
ncbi:Transcriptional regulatory protein, C terminal [Dyadobacter soli]|uniref:Transcriptional regulatory protein, C terminal n=1 Tax=Dyadobacter soli TaxID=659014 RepID=A0A1G7Y0M6_9BACT|nr:winged helix-turn-helix domain-containing protein [Dyadobacter soli]SDG89883.1 Transcriptional regulatory protein, C terminal [Dyadobacter soli]